MMIRFFALLLALAVTAASAPSFAQDTYIQCPTQSLETNVTTKLPSGWWSTPQAGKLSDTEIVNIGGKAKLLCVYELNGTEVSIMREAPSDMGCTASSAGFKCRDAIRQGGSSSGSAGTSKTIDVGGQASADVPVKQQSGKTLTPGGTRLDTKPQVRSKGECPDPMLNGVEVKMLSRDPQGQYFFRLAAKIENRGAVDYVSSPGQQVVEIYREPQGGSRTRVESISFQSVPVGADRVEATHDVLRWRTSQEFPPNYRFSISYDPDIGSDNNPANDDCTVKNNSTTITGEEINAIIRGSGI